MYINISILNWFRKKSKWDKYFSFTKKICKNKYLEIEGMYENYHLFGFEFKVSFKEDHAGVRLSIKLFFRELSIVFYDSRHWDYENDCWQK